MLEQRARMPPEAVFEVESEVRVPIAVAQLIHLNLPDPAESWMVERDTYWLDMCLAPRPRNSRLCYRDRWARHRFEPVGTVCLVPPDESVQHRTEGGPRQASILCHLRPEPLRQWFDGEIDWTNRKIEAGLDVRNANIRSLLHRLAEEMRHPSFAKAAMVELIAAQLAIELARYFKHFDEIPLSGALAPWRLRRIEERLRDTAEAPTLDELARLCELSVRQLTRGFRSSRGCSIGDYIAESRIEHAKRLLTNGQSIKAIAYKLNFSSASGFCFAFRRVTGMTPGEFRASSVGPGRTQ
jgi:AraC family transcriptional regulator